MVMTTSVRSADIELASQSYIYSTEQPAWPKGTADTPWTMAQKLSHQLRAAEDRIAELEAEVAAHQDRAGRAEQWLHKVYTEIEDRFLRQENRRNGTR
jgi:hypothetical protein